MRFRIPATLVILTLAATCGAAGARAQSESGPAKGAHELQVWMGGGYSGKGGVRNIGVWNAGVRYGWVFTDLHGPLFLRGRFEYAMEVAPIYWLFQPTNIAYGVSVTPIVLKWDFQERRGVVPYFEMGGGALFTSARAPTGISRVNFASGGAFGFHFLRKRYNWSAELRFQHISDAGLTDPNPGINTVQVRLGLGRFAGGR